jgi:hypothetical protein
VVAIQGVGKFNLTTIKVRCFSQKHISVRKLTHNYSSEFHTLKLSFITAGIYEATAFGNV